jgi:hypothetical protein
MNTRFICPQCDRFEDAVNVLREFPCETRTVYVTCNDCERRKEAEHVNEPTPRSTNE